MILLVWHYATITVLMYH